VDNKVFPTWADSSAGEHRPYKPGVAGSNPVPPTTGTAEGRSLVAHSKLLFANSETEGTEGSPVAKSQWPFAISENAVFPGDVVQFG
jgi:hypothetical protein